MKNTDRLPREKSMYHPLALGSWPYVIEGARDIRRNVNPIIDDVGDFFG